jgi:hypothetical protein
MPGGNTNIYYLKSMDEITYNASGEPLPWEEEKTESPDKCWVCKINPRREGSCFCSIECQHLYWGPDSHKSSKSWSLGEMQNQLKQWGSDAREKAREINGQQQIVV